MRPAFVILSWTFLAILTPAFSDEPVVSIGAWLERPILEPQSSLSEVQKHCAAKVPTMPALTTLEDWQAQAKRLREETLANTVYRGQASAWRDAKLGVEYLDYIEAGPGYKIRKLRYEALPGMWIPALLYLPEKLEGKVPVALNVNGHDPHGKAAEYKQMRCINQAKRGIIALNPEWFNMGQLAHADFVHYRLNQLDLCGTSGVAPFYLSMKRGLDILLEQPHADPARVAVSGLSGGGWQTILISSLDPRVTLSNPVAGYSSLLTRIGTRSDLGDSEQQPADLGLTADYTHLTALLAPRPTLLTYNAKDNCCFVAQHALPPLLAAAEPVFKLYGKEAHLRTHVNETPGDHNFGQENREAHYRMLGDHFFPGLPFDAHEIPSGDEIKSKDQLHVPLPEKNASLHSLALDAMRDLPRDAALPTDRGAVPAWQSSRREALKKILRYQPLTVTAGTFSKDTTADSTAVFWRLRLQDRWTVPAVEFSRGTPVGTTILIADAGRQSLKAEVENLLKRQQRVLAIDPFYLGESGLGNINFLYAILVSTVGDRPLGIQSAQLAAIADWQQQNRPGQPIAIQAHGPRSSLMALSAAAVQGGSISEVRLHESLGSLKEVIEQNKGVNESPEYFCFGLLEHFDIRQLAALAAPGKVICLQPSPRAKTELAPLKEFYQLLDIAHSPIQ